MSEAKPLIVTLHEDDRTLSALEALLGKEYLLIAFHAPERAINFVRRNAPDLVLAQRPASASEGLDLLERIKQASPSTEGIFLPSPLVVGEDGALHKDQSSGILRIIDRLLALPVFPEFRRVETRSFRVRPVQA